MRAQCQRIVNRLHWSHPELPVGSTLLQSATRSLASAALALLLQACAAPAEQGSVAVAPGAAAAPAKPVPAPEPEKVPVGELTLHLPEPHSPDCDCSGAIKATPTFLEKGFAALAARDYREAVNYFRRYQRLESSPGVDWEASIAVAYVKMIPESPYYNWRAARESYLRLMREVPQGVKLHEQVELYRDTLAILIDLHMQVNDLQSESAALSEALEKREEALRRLRELTLGQKAAAP